MAAIEEVLATDFPFEIELVVVDDGSIDRTFELISHIDDKRVHVHRHGLNQGKGVAVRTALQHAHGEFSAIFDGDLEYQASDLIELMGPLLNRKTNAVFGVRRFRGTSSYSYLYVLGNRAVTLAANVVFNVYLEDIMTCQKAIETELFRRLPLVESGFAIESEIAARLVQAGEKIYELPVSYNARTREEGKKLTSLDGLRVLRTLLRCRFTPGRLPDNI